MPSRPARICSCGKTVPSGRACACQEARKRAADRQRPSAHARGYDSEWRRHTAIFLARPENRLCACGCGRVADTVDHREPHRGHMGLFWSRQNWRPMYHACHSRKTAKQDGGFGNPIRREGGPRASGGSPQDRAPHSLQNCPDFLGRRPSNQSKQTELPGSELEDEAWH